MKQIFAIIKSCCLVFIFAINLTAQTRATIFGNVVDASDSTPLANVNIIIERTNIFTATDEGGHYEIENIVPGKYEVVASRIGFTSVKKIIAADAGDKIVLNFELNVKVIEIDPLTVTATRSKSLLTDIPVPTEVITSEDIEQSNAQNLGELLDNVPGVFIRSNGDLSALKSIGIRGSSSQQVLVLLDGQKLNDANGLGLDFSTFTLGAFDRIEIYRGGGSSIYGADAIGGVINIFTKQHTGGRLSGAYGATVGSFGTRIHNLNLGQNLNRFFYNFSYNRTDTDGGFEFSNPDTRLEQTRENADLSSDDFLVKLGYDFHNHTVLTFTSQLYDSERGVAGDLLFGFTPKARQNDERRTFSAAFNTRLTDRLDLKVQPYYNFFNNRYVNPVPPFPIDSETQNKSFGVDITQQAILNANSIMTYGYTFRRDEIDGSNIKDKDRNTHSVYVQDDIELYSQNGKVILIPAVRIDHHSDYGSQFSPKLGFLFSTPGSWKTIVRANIGRSFRAPGFSELYFPFYGNPDLKPEVAINFDVGMAFKFPAFGGVGAEVTFFRNDVDDLIIATPDDPTDPFSSFSPQNVSQANVQGIETKFSVAPIKNSDLINLEFNYTWLDAVDKGDNPETRNSDLIYRPSTLNILTRIKYSFFTFNIENQYTGKRFYSQSPPLSLPGYWISKLNFGVSRVINSYKLFVRYEANNLFDNQDFQVINGYPVAGRESSVTLGMNF